VTNRSATQEELIKKAQIACVSAKVLFDLGDIDGASNRAYYAMFDAARASLLAVNAPLDTNIARTHAGLIGAFGQYLVKPGIVPKEFGRILNAAQEIRLLADYNGDSVNITEAQMIVSKSQEFVDYVHSTFVEVDSGEGNYPVPSE
jgi:uncharacterized protein (UPF0332 family)